MVLTSACTHAGQSDASAQDPGPKKPPGKGSRATRATNGPQGAFFRRTDAVGVRHRALVHDEAGHGVTGAPCLAAGVYVHDPSANRWTDLDLGGTQAADARAKADSRPRILELLQR
ncbi:hypothetical protein [Streptomyces parvulus]|uniref:hypothetical protein n=1 Tax=Streptomyces parvulus TaxID=146923 RepID=UPI0036AF8AB0